MADLPQPTARTRYFPCRLPRAQLEDPELHRLEALSRCPAATMGRSAMTGTARAAASRKNGARSQGPRTAAGKARSARNALTHGLRSRRAVLLDDEDAAEFRAFASALQVELAPEGRLQADLAGRIVMAAWRARRADKLEAGLLGTYVAAPGSGDFRPARDVRHRPDPGQLWPARVRHSGPLPRLGAGGAVPLARGPQAAPGGGSAGLRARSPSSYTTSRDTTPQAAARHDPTNPRKPSRTRRWPAGPGLISGLPLTAQARAPPMAARAGAQACMGLVRELRGGCGSRPTATMSSAM